MTISMERRQALALGLAATIGAGCATYSLPAWARGDDKALIPERAHALRELTQRLAEAPRRRDFKTVPMILTSPEQWDHEALSEVIAYKSNPKQVWDNTDIASPWLNLMRNAVNAQIWSFKHPNFLAVSATHGTAHLALYDQAMWDKYQLTKLAGDKFQTNTLIVEKKAQSANTENYEDPAGAFSPEDNSIPALMSRGVVFMSFTMPSGRKRLGYSRRTLTQTSSAMKRWRLS